MKERTMQLNSPNSRCGEGWTSPLVDFSRNLLSLTLKHEAKHTQTVRALHLVSSSDAADRKLTKMPVAGTYPHSQARELFPQADDTRRSKGRPPSLGLRHERCGNRLWFFFFFFFFLNSEACVLHEESNANEWPLLGGEQSQIEIIQHVSTRADAPNGFWDVTGSLSQVPVTSFA